MSCDRQTELALVPDTDRCPHEYTFLSHAYVPVGDVCCDCGLLVSQTLPQPPEVLGYLSADWAWHHNHGKPWTTQTAADLQDAFDDL
jgi:hypothetical protein